MKQLRDNLCAKPGGADCKYFRIQKGRYQLKLKKKRRYQIECKSWEYFIDEVRL